MRTCLVTISVCLGVARLFARFLISFNLFFFHLLISFIPLSLCVCTVCFATLLLSSATLPVAISPIPLGSRLLVFFIYHCYLFLSTEVIILMLIFTTFLFLLYDFHSVNAVFIHASCFLKLGAYITMINPFF